MRRLLLPIILLALAVVIGITTYFFLIVLQRPHPEDILVAKDDIHSGDVLKEGMVSAVEWQGKKVPQDFIRVSDKKRYIGRVLAVDIIKGTPIVKGSLSRPGAPIGVYAKIPPGLRALTVKVDQVSGVAGFIRPGSRVDVLLAAGRVGSGKGQESKIILQNVLVLASGRRTTQIKVKGKEEPKVVNTITLLLSPEGAEKLSLASKMGALSLALRTGGDTDIVRTRGSKAKDVWGEVEEETPTLVAKAPDEKSKERRDWVIIELIQGGVKEEVSVPYAMPQMTEPEAKPEVGTDIFIEKEAESG
ncbi:MAG: Flp pilus assembly protein CpaB [Planctomycetota bacterium]|jgi:pilus assembly protein CpaB